MNSFSSIDTFIETRKMEERERANEAAMDALLSQKRMLGLMRELKGKKLPSEFSEIRAVEVQEEYREINESGDELREEVLSLLVNTDTVPFAAVLDRGDRKKISKTEGIAKFKLYAPQMTASCLEKLIAAIEASFRPARDGNIEFRMKIQTKKEEFAQIDARVAEEIMGLSPDGEIPNYSEDINEALKAAQKLKGTEAAPVFNRLLPEKRKGKMYVNARDVCEAALEAKAEAGREEPDNLFKGRNSEN